MSSEGYTEVPTSERTSMLFILTVKMGTAADGFGQPVLIMGEKSQSSVSCGFYLHKNTRL